MKDQNLRSHMDRNHDQIAKSNSRQNLELHPHQQQISSSPPDNQPQPVPRNRHAPQAARDTPPHRDQDQDTIKRPTNGGQSHPHSRQHSGGLRDRPSLPDVVNPSQQNHQDPPMYPHRDPDERFNGYSQPPPPQNGNINVQPRLPTSDQMPEIRKYKKRFNSEINCASLWGVNLLIGTNNGLLLLDRSGQGQAYPLITNRKFQQIDVLENLNLVLSISGKKNKLRVYYLSWLKSKIDPKFSERNSNLDANQRQGFTAIGDLEGCTCYKDRFIRVSWTSFRTAQARRHSFEPAKIAVKNGIDIFAWAPKPYARFMLYKRFENLAHRPLIVDLTVEEGTKLKVIFGSERGFHAIDIESGHPYDLYTPSHIPTPIIPHAIVVLPESDGTELLLCYNDEGIYVNTYSEVTKDIMMQWGELPASVAFIRSGQVMGWGEKAIEIRSVDKGLLDGVFMHKRANKLKFLCERNDKVFFASVQSPSNAQVYFMSLPQRSTY